MASFTDNIPTFNPYVSQQPVETMAKVGMAKQQQYDTNLEKIYSSMDTVAGLDIMKDADRDYLDKKMNDMSQKLNVYAGSDLSQNNITKKLTGMVDSIADDEIVQTAVMSTMRIRSEVGKMEKAKKDGKSSMVNEYFLNKDISTYLQGTEPGESFSGAWTPYIDVDKKLREVFKNIEETDITIENPFKRDANGNTLYFGKDGSISTDPSKGSKQIDHAMLSKTVKGKSAEKILNNFYTSLSADELRQIDMNGAFHYKNATAQSFIPSLKKAAETKKDFYKNSIKQIAIQLESDPRLTNEQKKELKDVARKYQTSLNSGEIDKELQEQIHSLQDPNVLESMKVNVYKDQYLRNMALNMETESISIEYKNNPYFAADMKMKDYNLKIANANRQRMHQDRMFNLQLLKFQKEEQEKEFVGQGVVRNGFVDTKIDDERLTSKFYETENENYRERINNAGTRVISKTNLSLLELDDNSLDGKNRKEATKLQLEALDKLYQKWAGGKYTSENANLNDYFENRKYLEDEIMYNTSMLAGAEDVVKEAGIPQKIQELGKKYPGRVVGGVYYTFEEMIRLKNIYNSAKVKKMIPSSGADKGPVYIYDTDMQKLSNQYKGKELAFLQNVYKHDIGTEDSDPILQEVWEDLRKVSLDAMALRRQENEIMSNYFKKKNYKLSSKKLTLDMSVKPLKNRVDLLLDESQNISNDTGALDTYEKVEFEDINLLRADENTSYTVEKLHDGTGNLILDNGENRKSIPLSSEQLASYFPRTQQPEILQKAVRNTRAFNGVSNSAAIVGPDAAATAVYSAKDFPQVAQYFSDPSSIRFDIKARDSNIGDGKTDKFNLIYYINTSPNTDNPNWISKETSHFVNIETIQAMIKNFNPLAATEIIKNYYKKQPKNTQD